MTRHEARAAGRARYTGAPCLHGHGGERYVRNATCCVCEKKRTGDRYAELMAHRRAKAAR